MEHVSGVMNGITAERLIDFANGVTMASLFKSGLDHLPHGQDSNVPLGLLMVGLALGNSLFTLRPSFMIGVATLAVITCVKVK